MNENMVIKIKRIRNKPSKYEKYALEREELLKELGLFVDTSSLYI